MLGLADRGRVLDLFEAVMKGDCAAALAELSEQYAAGADPLLPMEDGTTALMAAVGLGLNRSTNRRSQLIAPELVAAEWANEGLVLDTVKTAVDAGAAAADVINETGRGGNTALHGAVRNRFRTVVEFLVAQGGDLDIENEDETTPRELLERLDAS